MIGVHSPGPWRVGSHGGGASIEDAGGLRIASLAWGRHSVSMKVGFEAGIANLRLMVAAPALLRALRAVLDSGVDLGGSLEVAAVRAVELAEFGESGGAI